MARPVALEAHRLRSGSTQPGVFARRGKLAVAVVVAGVSMASSFFGRPLTDTAAAASDTAGVASTAVQATLPSREIDRLPPVLVSSVAPATSLPSMDPAARLQQEQRLDSLRAAHSATPGNAKPKKRFTKLTARDPKPARLAKSPGPVALCASRFFLLRPLCVQSHCSEAQFHGHAECEQQNHPAHRYARN